MPRNPYENGGYNIADNSNYNRNMLIANQNNNQENSENTLYCNENDTRMNRLDKLYQAKKKMYLNTNSENYESTYTNLGVTIFI